MSKTLTSRQYLSQLNTIYFSQAGIMLIFTAIVFALSYIGTLAVTTDESLSSILTYSLLAVVILGFSASHFLYAYLASKIDKDLPLQKKMPKYTGVIMVRSACLELPGMFAAIVFFITGNTFILLIPIFISIVFILLRPTASLITTDLNLSSEDRDLLNNPESIIAEIEDRRKK